MWKLLIAINYNKLKKKVFNEIIWIIFIISQNGYSTFRELKPNAKNAIRALGLASKALTTSDILTYIAGGNFYIQTFNLHS